ncbi:MAG: ABC-type Fe3+-hydroxamate transport system substrate-binding protein [Planctomycetota bacterium]|jgi:ABC-type Fe3+-hydroxamate transport system substrate-binding protein
MRIVSLCPSLSELVFDLGLVPTAITTWCCHPADRVGAIEKVGGTKDPDVARIIELAPDLVLVNEEENRLEDAEALRAAGIAIHNSYPKTVADTAEMVRSIAAAAQRPEEGEAIASLIEERALAASQAAEGHSPVRYAYLIWRKPWMVAGADTFVAGQLAIAGGQNVFQGGTSPSERYPAIMADELGSARPDLVLLPDEPFHFQPKHIAELSELSGLPRDCFLLADGERLSWHGSRTPSGIDYAAELMESAHRRASL